MDAAGVIEERKAENVKAWLEYAQVHGMHD
jgi:hypothetical protein